MANLTVRDVEDEIAQALKVRAAAHGRSAEAEHRLILREVLSPGQQVDDYAAAAARLRARLRHAGELEHDHPSGAGRPARVTGVVVDASVALKWVVEEDGSAAAAQLLDGRPLHAPPLIFVETANALWTLARRGVIDADGAADAFEHLRRAPFAAMPAADLLPQALRLAQALDRPVHDCVYLSLALLREVPVVTADRRLVSAARRDPDVAILVQPLEVRGALTLPRDTACLAER